MRGRSTYDLPLLFCLTGMLVLLSGCVATSLQPRPQIASAIAEDARWQPLDLETATYRLRLYLPKERQPRRQIAVYIEGDGLAWIDQATPSSDPTPRDPIALRLATTHHTASAAYIARPCQYTLEAEINRCQTAVWTNARYSEPVIAATSQAIDHIKSVFQAQEIVLVGYSGGGVVAALLAARRPDISLLVTVAANLDTEFWTRHHSVSPLAGSLNPADFGSTLKRQRQIHFVGSDDVIVPPSVARSYALKIDKTLLQNIRKIEDADHTCCWDELWPAIARDIVPPG